jgi:hypothetical protein
LRTRSLSRFISSLYFPFISPFFPSFPNVRDGCRGMEFIHAAVESANRNAAWIDLPATQ